MSRRRWRSNSSRGLPPMEVWRRPTRSKVLAGRLMTSDHDRGIRICAASLGPVERRRACQEVALGTSKVYMGTGVRRPGYGERHSVEKTERGNGEG